MNKELIINSSSSEVVIALLEDKLLVEIHREKHDSHHAVGDVYLGRIRKVMPGLSAAFVDIGDEKDAFLHHLDLGPQIKAVKKLTELGIAGDPEAKNISGWELSEDLDKSERKVSSLKPNQSLVVQISKESISTKGPRVSCELSFAGRYLVLMPFSNQISISSKIKSVAERDRLRYTIQSILPKNFGVIIRTVAEGKSVVDLDGDLRHLMEKWNSISVQLPQAKPPKLLLSEQGKTMKILRDLLNKEFNNIVVNDEEIYREIKAYLGSIAKDKVDIVKYHKNGEPIFDAYGVAKQIKSGFGRVVPIKRTGAYLVIEHTEALHVIDVNSGRKMNSEISQEENALNVNLEAAEEIVRQIRLRDLGGIIVIDFIDLRDAKNRKILYGKVKELMKRDSSKHNILPPSKFGLVQMTRQRVRTQTNIQVLEKCPVCDGTGKVKSNLLLIDDIEQNLNYLIREQNFKNLTLEVNPFVYAFLKNGFWNYSRKWFWKYKQCIKIVSSTEMHYLQYRFLNSDGEEIKLN
ncbi:MAG: Rne/Rng family ribonuclease [Bacteroidales bacterium]|nr:Rne/Rng family ribonuclease [Bacteroidales bacterium]